MNKYFERIYNGIVTENPTIVLMLGMCPTLAVTTSAINGIGMGLSSMAVLIFSNLIISLMRNIIPDEVRLPAYIVIVATLVTIVDLIMQAYTPEIYASLGIYIPLIVVNCIILGRAEAYANKATPGLAVMDGIGMGIGFTLSLLAIGLVREVLGAGQFFGHEFIKDSVLPIAIFGKAPGAFLVMAVLVAVVNALHIKTAANKKVEGCDGCCASCASSASCDSDRKEAAK